MSRDPRVNPRKGDEVFRATKHRVVGIDRVEYASVRYVIPPNNEVYEVPLDTWRAHMATAEVDFIAGGVSPERTEGSSNE